MNTNLAPTHKKMFGDYWVLWYAISNSYSITTLELKLLLDSYLESKTTAVFEATVSNDLSDTQKKHISDTLYNYLKTCNHPYIPQTQESISIDTSQRIITKHYDINGTSITVHYSSISVSKTVHPAIASYCTEHSTQPLVVFEIYLKNNDLFLFRDEQLITRVPQKDYHHIQGKFIIHLLNVLHKKEEEDWIGTLHGSTITDGESSILFIGKSGKGKSTLCALLAANGFDLLADDVSPLLSENQHIYYNPSAISIKKGAFDVLEPVVHNFDKLPIVRFNKSKGDLKYLPCIKPKRAHYPCRAIILVNYTPKSETKIEFVSVKTILETLIEDSWLSPNPKHAQQFLDWLKSISMYQLTYSDTDSVTAKISTLFKQLNIKAT